MNFLSPLPSHYVPRWNPAERVKPVLGVSKVVEDGDAGVNVERGREPEHLPHRQPGVADSVLFGLGQRVIGRLLADQGPEDHDVVVAVLCQVGSGVGRQVDEVLRGKQVLQTKEVQV